MSCLVSETGARVFSGIGAVRVFAFGVGDVRVLVCGVGAVRVFVCGVRTGLDLVCGVGVLVFSDFGRNATDFCRLFGFFAALFLFKIVTRLIGKLERFCRDILFVDRRGALVTSATLLLCEFSNLRVVVDTTSQDDLKDLRRGLDFLDALSAAA